jgi:hypothetical protein
MRIGRLRYWRLSDLVAWERSRCGKSVAEIALAIERYSSECLSYANWKANQKLELWT